MAVLMYTFGVFVQSGGLRINVRVLFFGALTDVNHSVALGRVGIFFFIYPFSYFPAFRCLAKKSLSQCFNVLRKRIFSAYFVTLKNIKIRCSILDVLQIIEHNI